MNQPSTIRLIPAEREQRPYLDIMVDGRSLVQLFSPVDYILDVIPPFGWPEETGHILQKQAAARFLLQAEPDLPSGRYSLLVCPECADTGCGAVTAVIERKGDLFEWRDFGYETNYGAEEERISYSEVDRLTFVAQEYIDTFARLSAS